MEEDKLQTRVKTLVEAFPYIRKLKNSLLVIKFGGAIIDSPKLIESILYDISFLKFLGMKPIIVHGGGKAITKKLSENNIEATMINGLRYTCKKSIKFISEVLNNDINKKLSFILKNFSVDSLGINGVDVLKAKKKQISNVDLGFVGEIVGVDTKKILNHISRGLLPVISPLAIGSNGVKYNVNADEVAAAVSVALSVRKIIFITDVPGILKNPKDKSSLMSSIKVDMVTEMIKKGILKGGMLPKIQSSVECLKKGIKKVHFIDGNISHSLLLEILSDEGIGTEITF